MTEPQDVDALKRRGRRRLIGAIALMLLAVIILPMVFDAEPRISAPPVNVRIPDEDGSAFKPRVLPPGATEAPRGTAQTTVAVPTPKEQPPAAREAPAEPPAAPVASAPAAAPAAVATAAVPQAVAPTETPPAKSPVAPAATTAAAKSTPAAAPKAATEAALAPKAAAKAEPKAAASKSGFVIPIAALAEAEKVKTLTGTLAGAKIPYFTEPLATAKGQVTRVRAGPFASKEQAEQVLAKLKALGLKPGNVTARNG